MSVYLAMHVFRFSSGDGHLLGNRVPGDSSSRGTMSCRHTTCVNRAAHPEDSIRAASLPLPTMGAAKVQQLMSSPGATSPLCCLQSRGHVYRLPGKIT